MKIRREEHMAGGNGHVLLDTFFVIKKSSNFRLVMKLFMWQY